MGISLPAIVRRRFLRKDADIEEELEEAPPPRGLPTIEEVVDTADISSSPFSLLSSLLYSDELFLISICVSMLTLVPSPDSIIVLPVFVFVPVVVLLLALPTVFTIDSLSVLL